MTHHRICGKERVFNVSYKWAIFLDIILTFDNIWSNFQDAKKNPEDLKLGFLLLYSVIFNTFTLLIFYATTHIDASSNVIMGLIYRFSIYRIAINAIRLFYPLVLLIEPICIVLATIGGIIYLCSYFRGRITQNIHPD